MEKPRIIDRLKPVVQSVLGPRGRVALLMASLATAPACKINFNFDLAASMRDAMVGKENVRHIMIPEADASVVLGTKEIGDQTVVEGVLYVSPHSPLRTPSKEIREYKLPSDAHPFISLVVEPSGRAILRTESDVVALAFKCDDKPTCAGNEIDAKKWAKEHTALAKKIEEDKKNGHSEDGTKAHAKNDEKHVAKGPAVEGTPSNYTIRADLEKDFLKLRTALKSAGFAYRVDIIRKHGGKWRKSLEPMIQEFENDKSAAGLVNKSNTGEAMLKETLFIVGSDPELFKKIAKDLNVKLDDKKPDSADKKKKPEKYNTAVLELNEGNFKTEVLDVKDKPVLVNFWATWCGACKQQAPIIEQLAAELGDRAVIAKLDVDKNKNLSTKYKASALPTMTLFYNGQVVAVMQGTQSKADLLKAMKKYLPKGPNWI